MRKLLLFACCLAAGLSLGAQAVNQGQILFETDFREFDLEAAIPDGFSITGINLRIRSTANSTGVELGDPTTYPSIAMDPPPGGRTEAFYVYDDNAYTAIYQPNGTTGNAEIRWWFEAVISDGAGALDTIRENLANDVVAAGELDIMGCQVFPQAGTHVRRYFMNGNQNRALRAKLGSCYMLGNREMVLTIDMSTSDQAVTNIAFVPAMGRMMAWNSFPNFNLTANGDGTYSGRFAVGNPEYLVYSYARNFNQAEAALMNGLIPRACGLFDFGSREYFHGSSTPIVKNNDDLWVSYTEDQGGTLVQPFQANSTITANASATLSDGYTYYLNGIYKLLAINWGSETPAAPGDVSVTFGASQAVAYDAGEGFITNPNGAVMMGRTYDVNATIGSNVDVRYYFTQADLDAVNAELTNDVTASDLQFYKVVNDKDPQDVASLTRDDVIVYSEGGAAPDTEASTYDLDSECVPLNSVTYSVSSFSGGGGGGVEAGGNFLPVEFASISATPLKRDVMVKWATASESGNEGFQVEHSTNGQDFRALGTVATLGNGTTGHAYSFEHVNAPEGVNFYRLKQMDLDGAFSYSEVVTATVNDAAEALALFPNPATNELTVRSDNGGQVEIRDARGQLILNVNNATDRESVDVSPLTSGLYFVTVRNGNETTTRRFIKR